MKILEKRSSLESKLFKIVRTNKERRIYHKVPYEELPPKIRKMIDRLKEEYRYVIKDYKDEPKNS